MSRTRVAVLMGGTSAERDISLATGRQILASLDRDRFDPVAIDAAALRHLGSAPAALPAAPCAERPDLALAVRGDAGVLLHPPGNAERPDVVFIALHGRGGEDGTVQGLLDLAGIPYTGSGVLASALAMDKEMAKRVLRAEGIPVPGAIVLARRGWPGAEDLDARVRAAVGYPAVVKPNAEGSTIGCAVVRDPAALAPAVDAAFLHDDTVLIEQYIPGVEITAALIGNEDPRVLPLIEIVAASGFYDYEAKYAPGGSQHMIPARISERAAAAARDHAVRCHRALKCRGMSRVDMIVTDDVPYVLEVNTIPGMTPTSLLPEAARAAGIPFRELLSRLIDLALA